MSAGDDKIFALDCLQAHNRYREMHNCPPLKLNEMLSTQALLWAQELLRTNGMYNSMGTNYGENIYMAEGIRVTGEMPVQAWYDEIADYNFDEAQFKPGTGHFTQVIWKDSKELGVGIAQRGRLTYVVTKYSPPGNYRGKFQENVLLKIKDVPLPKRESEDLPSTSSDNKHRLSVPRELIEISSEDRNFHWECLEAHNKYRAIHGVSRLKLNEQLSQYATTWALRLSETNQLQHSPSKKFGENIYKSEGVHINGASAVRIWYEAADEYDFSRSTCSPESGSFTQLVWKDSKGLGVGVARKDRITVVVASYYPAGNICGLFKENVFPKIKKGDKNQEVQSNTKDEEVQVPIETMDEEVQFAYETMYESTENAVKKSKGRKGFMVDENTQASMGVDRSVQTSLTFPVIRNVDKRENNLIVVKTNAHIQASMGVEKSMQTVPTPPSKANISSQTVPQKKKVNLFNCCTK